MGGRKMHNHGQRVLDVPYVERNSNVCVEEGGYISKNITELSDIDQSYRLRHQIFCQELGWVPETPDEKEIDEYDLYAIPFGVFDKDNRLMAYLRLIISDRPFMLEDIFSSLVSPEHKLRKDRSTAEVSRVCVAKEARRDGISGNFGYHSVVVFLMKAVYQWCKINNIRYFYAVTEHSVFRLSCAKGFPYKLIGEPKKMPDGVVAVAILMDWNDFERIHAAKRPKLLEWFNQSQPNQAQMQSPQHESGLRRPIFA